MLILAVIASLLYTRPWPGTAVVGRGRDAALPSSSGSFTIEGNATFPISPGVMAPLDLKLTNPHDVYLSVTGLNVTVQKVSAPNADHVHPRPAGDFAVDQVSSRFEITLDARSASTLSDLGLPRAQRPQVGMLDRSVNQDGCKGVSLMLTYSASGTLNK